MDHHSISDKAKQELSAESEEEDGLVNPGLAGEPGSKSYTK